MSAKRAVTSLKNLVLSEVTTNTSAAYVSAAGTALPYAGSLNRTPKENKTDLYYDDDLYAQLHDVKGEDVEIRVAEVPLSRLASLGLGTYDATNNTLEADFAPESKEYSLRFETNTVSGLSYYWNYRLFQMTGIRFDNFATRKDSVTVCEVIITGVLKRPELATLMPLALMQLADDKTNQTACTTFLTAAETKP